MKCNPQRRTHTNILANQTIGASKTRNKNAIPCCSTPLVLTPLGVSRTGDRTGSQDIQALELPTGEPLQGDPSFVGGG